MSTTRSDSSIESCLDYNGDVDRDKNFSPSPAKLSRGVSSSSQQSLAAANHEARLYRRLLRALDERRYRDSLIVAESNSAASKDRQDLAQPPPTSSPVRLELNGKELLDLDLGSEDSRDDPEMDGTNVSIVITEPDSDVEEISECYMRQNKKKLRSPMRRILMAGYIAKEFPEEVKIRSKITDKIPACSGMDYLQVPANNEVWAVRKEVLIEIQYRALARRDEAAANASMQRYLNWRTQRAKQVKNNRLKTRDLGFGGSGSESESTQDPRSSSTTFKRARSGEQQAKSSDDGGELANDDKKVKKSKRGLKRSSRVKQKKELADDEENSNEPEIGTKTPARSKQKKTPSQVQGVKGKRIAISWEEDANDNDEESDPELNDDAQVGGKFRSRPRSLELDFIGGTN